MDALLLNLMSRKMQVLNAVMREGVPPLNRPDVPGLLTRAAKTGAASIRKNGLNIAQ
jgi:hypothetical protein